MRLLLGSGGFSTPERKEGWRKELDQYLGNIQSMLFIPYALADHDNYVAKMNESGFQAGRHLTGIHRENDPKEAILKAEAIYVGGGNSFPLLKALYELDLLDTIRARIRSGTPYVGVSAGTNMACPTMMTTNDMPIVYPPSLKALGLISFQINPHYFAGPIYMQVDGKVIPYGGETRDDRLREFHEANEVPVLGIWEGGILRIEGERKTLAGVTGARLFRRGEKPVDLMAGAEVDL